MSCRGLEKNCTSKSFCTKDHDGTHELWMGNSIIFATIMLLVANLAKSDTVHCRVDINTSFLLARTGSNYKLKYGQIYMSQPRFKRVTI